MPNKALRCGNIYWGVGRRGGFGTDQFLKYKRFSLTDGRSYIRNCVSGDANVGNRFWTHSMYQRQRCHQRSVKP